MTPLMKGMIHRQGGFSYVEMVFAVAMLALLAAVAAPYLEKQIQRQKESELKQSLRQIRSAIDAYKAAYDGGAVLKTIGANGYPPNLEILVQGVTDISSPEKKVLYFLRRIPADPMFPSKGQQQVSPAATWGLRSYESDADSPREGVDVYDVYSLSTEVGLNGVPYREW
jgi:general secretion pathway protein G